MIKKPFKIYDIQIPLNLVARISIKYYNADLLVSWSDIDTYYYEYCMFWTPSIRIPYNFLKCK